MYDTRNRLIKFPLVQAASLLLFSNIANIGFIS